jgi:opacity protein-like surface antigen
MARCDAIGRTVLQILCDVDLPYAQLLKGKNFEMIRLAVATLALIALMSACAFAQDSAPKVQVFGGYSFVHVDNGGLSPNTLYAALHEPNNPFAIGSNFNGWNAEAQYNFTRMIGIVADVSGRYGTPIISSRFATLTGLPKTTAYSFLVGPVLSFRSKSKLTPFVHVLFGFDRTSLNATTISGLANPLSSTATTDTDATVAFGGGLDYRLFRRLALRLFQVDDLRTYHNLDKLYDSTFNTGVFYNLGLHQNNIRISTGLSLRF